MAGTVTTNAAFFTGATGGSSAADAITDWTATGGVVDTVAFVQGTGSIYTYSAATTTVRTWAFASASTNVTGKVIYFWFALGKVAWLNTKAAGGLTLRIESSATDYIQWNIAGSDTLPHNGFICHCVHVDVTPDASGGTVNKGAINKFTITANGSFPGKAYLWVDAVRHGTYLQITGGTDASPAVFEDFITAESTVTNQWGIMSKVEGIYFSQGKIYTGSTVSGEYTYFKDTSKVLAFKDAKVTADFFEILVHGNSGTHTKVYFGTKSGEAGISGCTFRSAGVPKFQFSSTNTYITNLGVYGCSFFDASTISLPAYSVNKEVVSSNIEAGADILADTCIVKSCNFISADYRAVRMATASSITNCNFISNPRAVHIPNSGTYLFDALMFTGSTYDIDNTSGSTIDVLCVNGSNPSSTIGGYVNLINTVYLTIDVEDQAGGSITGASAYIENAATKAQLMSGTTDSTGRAQTTYNYTGTVDINARIRKSPTGVTRYFPMETTGMITSDGFATTAVLIKDEIAT